MADWPNIPPLINHRSSQDHYTKYISYIEECTYTSGQLYPPIYHRYMQHNYTEECTYTHGKLTPPPPLINSRSMQHPYIKSLSHTLDSPYNEKKYAEILLHYRWLFIKGNVFIGEWGIQCIWCRGFPFVIANFFVKGDFVIGRVECIWNGHIPKANIPLSNWA